MAKYARVSPLSRVQQYKFQHDWPEDSHLQCGDNGIVFRKNTLRDAFVDPEQAVLVVGTAIGVLEKDVAPEHYRTAFFEAFLDTPKTFIRGEGATIEDAEQDAWQQYQQVIHCSGPNGHEFESRGYTNGAGFCKFCGMFSIDVIPSPHRCVVCQKPTWYTRDVDGNYYCEEHEAEIPEEKLTERARWLRKMLAALDGGCQKKNA